ncbi:MAG TPA: TIGR03118 family protein [Pyrinomonadaceae bacterium]|nr:TIGR03118 family protein [Pyrinomonadaceae bacterium]
MSFAFPAKLPRRSVASALVILAFMVIALVSGRLPGSLAQEQSPDPPAPALSFVASYTQTNLVSNLPGIALIEDRQLVNPRGIAVGPNTPFWVINNQGDLATLYKGDVAGSPLVRNTNPSSVTILNVPTLLPAPAKPTAVVANNTTDFKVDLPPNGPQPAQFIVATENGGINAWHSNSGISSPAVVVRFNSGHQYTGLTIGSNASGSLLFAADFTSGKIDVFDKNFADASVAGNFTDATIPTNFHPYNIENLNGALYVTYAEFSHGLNSGFDLGFVRKFDTNGVRDLAFAINNGPLITPWGLVIAPANSGPFSGNLLVGNQRAGGVSSSSINAFDPATGAVIGRMVDGGGASLLINDLQGLVFGNGVNGGDSKTLYFSASGAFNLFSLFGSLKPVNGIAPSTIKFSSTEYRTSENSGHIDITVTRTGITTNQATVNYATVDGGARQKADYEIALGTLTFNPGETTKTFRVLVVDDKDFAGGSSADLNLYLTNATGAELTSPSHAYLYLMDDEFDTPGQPPNISDVPQFFVRQQYFDFLNREPDQAGLDFWTNQILGCGSDQACIELKRINVSAAFFLSIEFQKTGMLAYLTEKYSSGELPRYGQFMRDVQALQRNYVFGASGAAAQLEVNKQAFFDEFVTRPEFVAKFGGLSNSDFVQVLPHGTTAELYIAQLTGPQVVPPTNSPARALVILRQPLVHDNTIKVSLYLNGLTSTETEAQIHGPADAASNGPLITTLPAGELVELKIPFSNPAFLDLSAGRVYIDVHTTNFPNGEIRAQLPSNLFASDMIIRALDNGIITRAQALRIIVEGEIGSAELNRAFVLMEYFGYLRRNPDDPPDNNLTGYNFWLNKLNEHNGNFISADMVKSFLKSTEYRGRFGPP